MKKINTKKIAVTGIIAALTAVATIIIALPVPATEGYVNFGDTVIFVAAALFGPFIGGISGAVGSAVADLVYAPHWAVFTLIIKGAEGLLCGLFIKAFYKTKMPKMLSVALAFFISAVWMVTGYFFAGAVLYGFALSAASVVPNIVQGGVSAAAGFVIYLALSKIRDVENFAEQL